MNDFKQKSLTALIFGALLPCYILGYMTSVLVRSVVLNTMDVGFYILVGFYVLLWVALFTSVDVLIGDQS